MGVFYTGCMVQSHVDGGRAATLSGMLVDTGSEASWIPGETLRGVGVKPVKKRRFRTATGEVVERDIGFAIVRVGRRFTTDEVVFGRPGDSRLLGARTMEGIGVQVDPVRKRLVPTGPMIAASPTAVDASSPRKKTARKKAGTTRAKS